MPLARSATALVALALALSACAQSEPEREDDIVVGFLTMEGAPAASFPETTLAARAAVDHVNDGLGGIDGRRLRLETCATTGTPESSQTCAQRLLQADPIAVVGGVDLGAEASVPQFATAGVPYVTGSPTLAGELTADGSFAFTGGIAADLLALGQHVVEDRGAQRVAVLHADLPGLLNTAVTVAGDVFRARGVADVRIIAESVDAPDFAASLTAATAGDPDALLVVFPPQSCARVLQAVAALGVSAPVFLPGACASPAVAAAGAPVLDRVTFASAYEPVPAEGGSPEHAAFRNGVPEQQRSALAQASFSAVLNVAELLRRGSTDAAALRADLTSAAGEPNVFAHPYTCDRQQVPLLPSVCNARVRLLQHRDGAFVDVGGDWRDGVDLLRSLGGS